MANTKTSMRMHQISGSIPDQTKSAATVANTSQYTLMDLMDHTAAALKRIHGGDDWSNVAAGQFAGDIDLLETGGSSGAADFDVAGYAQFAGAVELDGAVQMDGALDLNSSLDADVSTWDVDASGLISLDSSGGAVSLNAAAASDFTTSAGALSLDGAAGVNIMEGGANVIAIDTDRDVLFSQTGGSTSDPDVEIDGYLRVDGASEFDGAVQMDGALDLNSSLDADVTTWDVDASGAITLDSSGGAVSLNAALASDFTTDAGALSLDGAEGVNIMEGGANVIAIDTNRDVLFSQTGGSTSDPDVEIDGYLRVDGASEFDGAVQMDGALDLNSSLDADVTTWDVDASGLISLDSSGGAVSLNAAAASDFTTSAGALSLDGNAGVNIMEGGANVIVIDTDRDVLFSQTGGSTSDPDVEIDGYLRVDGSSEFDGSVNIDGDLDVDNASTDLAASGQLAIHSDQAASNAIFIEATNAAGGVDINAPAGVNVSHDLVVEGNLDVNGTTTTIDTLNMTVQDSIIGLGVSGSGVFDNLGDRGIIFARASAASDPLPGLWWDGSTFNIGTSLTSPTSASFGSVSDRSNLHLGKVKFDDATASRLLGTDGSKNSTSINDLTAYIAGTANRVYVADDADGTVTLSGPQDIHTAANPTFAGLHADAVNVGIAGSNEIDTDSGPLILDSAVGEVQIDDKLSVTGSLTVGVDGVGHQVRFYSDTAGDELLWDDTNARLNITGMNGTVALFVDDGDVKISDKLDLDGSLDADVSTWDVDASGLISLDSSGGAVSLNAAAASDFTTSAGALSLDGAAGVNIMEGGANVIAIDTDRDVLFSQTGGSTSDPDVEIDGYLRVDGASEFDGAVQMDGALDLNSSLDADVSTWDVDASGAITLDSSGGSVSINAALASDFTTDAGRLTLDGKSGLNLKENGTSVITIDTDRDVVFTQTGGSTSDPDVEIDGYLRVDGDSEFDGAVQMDGALDLNSSLDADVTTWDVDASGLISLDSSGGAVSLNAAAASDFTTSAGALTLEAGAELMLDAAGGTLRLEDSLRASSTFTTQAYMSLADTAAEWTSYKTTFGEVSLLSAIVSAGSDSTRFRNVYTVTGSHAASSPLTMATANLTLGAGINLADAKDDIDVADVYVNGALQLSGSSSANGDFTLDGILGNDAITFFYQLEADDVVTVIEASRTV